jgi:hypothetical protein
MIYLFDILAFEEFFKTLLMIEIFLVSIILITTKDDNDDFHPRCFK